MSNSWQAPDFPQPYNQPSAPPAYGPVQPYNQPSAPPACGPVQPYGQPSAPQPYSQPLPWGQSSAPQFDQSYNQPPPGQPYSQPTPYTAVHVHQYNQVMGQVATAQPKSPGVAVLLQLLIVGLGHIYTGNPIAAIIWFFSAGLAWASLAIGIGVVLVPAVYIAAAVHAYISASNFNARHNTFH